MAKKLPVYVHYPLVLGLTCLICGGILAGVNAVTSPIIEANNLKKENAAAYTILSDDGLALADPNTLGSKTVYSNDSYINFRVDITCTDSVTYRYYNAISATGYKGKVTFGCLVEPTSYTVIGYTFIKSDGEDSLGIKDFAKKLIITKDNPYVSGGTLVVTGATVKHTPVAIATAMDACIADAQSIK
jgi:Na+-translocating ferredoxin:NAD+ oxidoreductase RnfG subunit